MRDYYDCHDWDIDGYPGEFVVEYLNEEECPNDY